jgi:hypothetical protein
MKKIIVLLLFFAVAKFATAQNEKEKVQRACLDYIEGFYEGDTTKLIRSLKPAFLNSVIGRIRIQVNMPLMAI